ncbi:MAG TPA: hypothetical protein VE224_18750 [Pseudolabrys sp.]|nr:hypothetical protein [Pseudolabrys sp.]
MKVMIVGLALGVMAMGAMPASAETVVIKRIHRPHHHHHVCKVTRIRTRMPNGNVVIKTRRVCR